MEQSENEFGIPYKEPESAELEELILCNCGDPEHQVIVTSDEGYAFMEIHLVHYESFWTRLRYALKYILGYKCKYGAFDEIILRKEDAPKFRKIANYLELHSTE